QTVKSRHLRRQNAGPNRPSLHFEPTDPVFAGVQLHALSIGKPVLFTQLVERHLRPAEPRANTNLVSRYRNSAEFGIALSLFYVGLLLPEEQKTVTEEGAVNFAIEHFREK